MGVRSDKAYIEEMMLSSSRVRIEAVRHRRVNE